MLVILAVVLAVWIGALDWRKVQYLRLARYFREHASRYQGQRPLNRCSNKDFEQVVFVPATTSAFHDQAGATGMLLQE
jgi:hypothetical protein